MIEQVLFSRSFRDSSAFTLLEVMIAIAILAITLATLYGSQAKSLSYATEARFDFVAPALAAAKLAELESRTRQLVSDKGDFGEDFPGFTWQIEIDTATFDGVETLAGLQEPLQQVDVTVEWAGSPYSYSLRYYGYWDE